MSELTGLTGHLDKIRADQLTLFYLIHGVTLFGFFHLSIEAAQTDLGSLASFPRSKSSRDERERRLRVNLVLSRRMTL